MPVLDDFQRLYRGRTDVWGSVEGKSNKEVVTPEHYRLHLEEKRSLGVYPLLDDGLCYFFACDIDDKSWEKALAIRNATAELNINMYISESKSKGWHVYGFCEEGIQAADIRWVLFSVLEKLGFATEIFPKQDKLDEIIKYGNYINLPCFGDTRRFHTADKQPLDKDTALSLIQSTPRQVIIDTRAVFPPPPAPIVAQAVTPKKRGKGKSATNPPCIEMLLKGVGEGMRDEAAFALARHYLDQAYTPEEVLTLLLQWDSRNKPPIMDQRVIQTKIQSATKGYAFGCNSIRGDDLLTQFCPGQNKCSWLIEVIKDKKKRGLLVEKSFYETPSHLYELIADTDNKFHQYNPRFLAFDRKNGQISEIDQIDEGEISVVPTFGVEAILGAIILPSGVEPYGTVDQLHKEICDHIYHYVDFGEINTEICAWYVIMTWCPLDRMFTTPYMRFRGDSGSGKSRSLDVVGRLCYKPLVVSGAVTPAPIYRIMNKYGGTVILDEADFSVSDEKAEVVKILNSSFEMGRPVLRCIKDNFGEFDCIDPYGSKILATRSSFTDKALESRCLTIMMRQTSREDIPPILGRKFRVAQQSLRRKLLAFRLDNYEGIVGDIEEEAMDLGHIEPRLRQTGVPLALALRHNAEAFDKFKGWLKTKNNELIEERGDSVYGRLVNAVFLAARALGRDMVTPGAIQKVAEEDLKLDISPQKIGRYLKDLDIITRKARVGGKIGRYIQWNNDLMRILIKKYPVDTLEDVEILFEETTLIGTEEPEKS